MGRTVTISKVETTFKDTTKGHVYQLLLFLNSKTKLKVPLHNHQLETTIRLSLLQKIGKKM